MSNKTENVSIRLTPEQKELLTKKAQENSQNLSAYIVHCAMQGGVVDISKKCLIYDKLQILSRFVDSNKAREVLDDVVEEVRKM